jgi:hypothetical protein
MRAPGGNGRPFERFVYSVLRLMFHLSASCAAVRYFGRASARLHFVHHFLRLRR